MINNRGSVDSSVQAWDHRFDVIVVVVVVGSGAGGIVTALTAHDGMAYRGIN
ncbi:MAG: hypothetical protein V3S33_02765 [Gammaproteobacteria bacterium]